jgi:SNF2 family DNA or RNA helicase
MQTNSFLKSFDKNIEKQLQIDTELKRIQSEQHILFDKKIEEAEKKIHATLSKELEKKYKTDLQNARTEMLEQYTNNINNLTQKLEESQTICIKNCAEIIKVFLNHHLLILNQHIVTQEIQNTIDNLFKDNQEKIVRIFGNTESLNEIQKKCDGQLPILNFIYDDTMIDGDIKIESDKIGIYFSNEKIMGILTDMCNDLNHHYFNAGSPPEIG